MYDGNFAAANGLTLPSSSGGGSNNNTTDMYHNPVFTGFGPERNFAGEPHRPGEAQMTTIGDLLNQFFQMNVKQVNELGQRLATAGFMNAQQVGNPDATEQAYTSVLTRLAKMTAAGNYVSFGDYMKMYADNVQQSHPSSYTNSTSQVSLVDPTSARQLLVKTLQNNLGRNPTASEYQAFLSAVHSAEQNNPTVTNTTYKWNAATNSYDTSNQTQSGGIDPSSFAAEYGQNHNQHEMGAYQAATTYFDALKQAVGAVI